MTRFESFLRKLGFTPYLWWFTIEQLWHSVEGRTWPPVWRGWRCPNVEPHGWHQCRKHVFHLGGCQD